MNSDNSVSTLLLHKSPDYVLLKVAINFAEQGVSTWFISIAPFEKIPENIQQPCKEVLQLITFIYLKDYVDLITHLNGTHKWKNIPTVIIVRDFDSYCSLYDVEYDSHKTAFLSSTLLDCTAFLGRKNDCAAFLLVCCSDAKSQKVLYERLQVLYDMYFDSLFTENSSKSDDALIENIRKEFLINKATEKTLPFVVHASRVKDSFGNSQLGYIPRRLSKRLLGDNKL